MTNSFELSYKKIIKIIDGAKRQAIKDTCEEVSLDYVIERLLNDKSIINILCHINKELKQSSSLLMLKDDIRRIITNNIDYKLKNPKNIKPSKTLEGILYQTRLQSLLFGRKIVENVDLFLCILYEKTKCTQYLNDVWGINKDVLVEYIQTKHKLTVDNSVQKTINDLRNKSKKPFTKDEKLHGTLDNIFGKNRHTPSDLIPEDIYSNLKNSIMNMAEGSKNKKNIDSFCINMNELIQKSPTLPVIGRNKEIEIIQNTVSRMIKSNIILVGQAGIGKTAIIEGLVARIIDKQIPKLDGYTIYSVDLGAMVAGTKYRGDFEERMKNLIEFAKSQPKAIFFIDEIHMIVGAGSASESTMDAANILKPALSRGEITIIGATTDKEYRARLEKDKALMRRFFKLNVDMPSLNETVYILKGIKDKFEHKFNVVFNDDVLLFLCKLCERFVHDSVFPDKAIDLIDSIAARYGNFEQQLLITKEMVISQLSIITKIPESLLTVSDEFDYDNIQKTLSKNIVGQSQAIEKIMDLLCLSYAGLRDKNKTILSLLMRGPTGVGKTELSKQLSDIMKLPLYRFDMSEYSESHTVSKLIGSPSGYVGYNDGDGGSGLLLNKVETTPHCIVLLDEIEKAHPNVINLLLQVMDNGFLMSGSGKSVSFQNVCLLMTSNIGAVQEQKNSIGFITTTSEINSDKGVADMKSFFPPEFLNRLDGIVRFNNLSYTHLFDITKLHIDNLAKQLKEKNINCKITKKVIEHLTCLAEKERNMGARPIIRLINNYIKIPLSKKILYNKDNSFNIDFINDEVYIDILKK